jgi:hypothetical protein
MNPGPVEEAGKAVSGIVDGLKQQPAVLSLTLILLGILVFLFYALHAAASFRNLMIMQQTEYQKYVTEILSRCIVPSNRGNFTLQSDKSEIVPLPPLRPLRPNE